MDDFIDMDGIEMPLLETDFNFHSDCSNYIPWDAMSCGFSHNTKVFNYTNSHIGLVTISNVLIVIPPTIYPITLQGDVLNNSILLHTSYGEPTDDNMYDYISGKETVADGTERGMVLISPQQIATRDTFYLTAEEAVLIIKPKGKDGRPLKAGIYHPPESAYTNPRSPTEITKRASRHVMDAEWVMRFRIFSSDRVGELGWCVAPGLICSARASVNTKEDLYPNGYFEFVPTVGNFGRSDEYDTTIIQEPLTKDGTVEVDGIIYTVGFDKAKKAIAVQEEAARRKDSHLLEVAAEKLKLEKEKHKNEKMAWDIEKNENELKIKELDAETKQYQTEKKLLHESNKMQHEMAGYESTERQWQNKEAIAEHSATTAKWTAGKAGVVAVAAAAGACVTLMAKTWWKK